MELKLIVDIVLVLMIAAGIFFAWRLQRALSTLQQNRQAMEGFIGTFVASIERAEKAIAELNGTARGLSDDVDAQTKKATALRDELHFLVDAADKVATRLSEKTSEAQGASRAARKEKETFAAAEALPEETKQTVPQQQKEEKQTVASPAMPAWAKRMDADARVLNKPVPEAPKPAASAKQERPRSQAERELMQALDKIR